MVNQQPLLFFFSEKYSICNAVKQVRESEEVDIKKKKRREKNSSVANKIDSNFSFMFKGNLYF